MKTKITDKERLDLVRNCMRDTPLIDKIVNSTIDLRSIKTHHARQSNKGCDKVLIFQRELFTGEQLMYVQQIKLYPTTDGDSLWNERW